MKSRAQGFSLVGAVFVIVILSAVGVFMLSVTTTQHQTTAMAAEGAQGYFAARAGVEWAAYQALEAGAPCSGSLGFSGYAVEVSCTSSTHGLSGDDDVTVWAITATATKGSFGDAGYVSRTLTMSIADG